MSTRGAPAPSRHYCQLCNVWLENQARAVRRHEQGQQHMKRLQLQHEQHQRCQQQEARRQKQLQDIEQKALRALLPHERDEHTTSTASTSKRVSEEEPRSSHPASTVFVGTVSAPTRSTTSPSSSPMFTQAHVWSAHQGSLAIGHVSHEHSAVQKINGSLFFDFQAPPHARNLKYESQCEAEASTTVLDMNINSKCIQHDAPSSVIVAAVDEMGLGLWTEVPANDLADVPLQNTSSSPQHEILTLPEIKTNLGLLNAKRLFLDQIGIEEQSIDAITAASVSSSLSSAGAEALFKKRRLKADLLVK